MKKQRAMRCAPSEQCDYVFEGSAADCYAVFRKNNKVKIVDCYDMNEVSEKVDTLMEKYKIKLGTAGEKVIENI